MNYVFIPKWNDYVGRISQAIHERGATRHVVVIPDAECLYIDYSVLRQTADSESAQPENTEGQPSVLLAHRTGPDAPAPQGEAELPAGFTWID